ncbi:hypothetical protein HOA64_00435 [bacterium]|nr:hypothetical protein [bacterium]MBT6831507.1 hypothetical protein [bacterium]MBT7772182.1 hypothetical protein [bacterium]
MENEKIPEIKNEKKGGNIVVEILKLLVSSMARVSTVMIESSFNSSTEKIKKKTIELNDALKKLEEAKKTTGSFRKSSEI